MVVKLLNELGHHRINRGEISKAVSVSHVANIDLFLIEFWKTVDP